MSTGTSVTDSAAAAAIAYVLVNASGAKSRPSCAWSENTGTNESVMMSRLKKSAGPTSAAASPMTRQCSAPASFAPGCACCHASSFLCAFSIMTIAASTIAPTAIAIPPSDMMFAFTPWYCITMNAISTPSGSVTIATNPERRWNRKARQTTATTTNSSTSLSRRWAIERSIRPERSYVSTISTPFGRLALSEASLALTAWMVSSAFLPDRITITPPTTSPSPSRSAIPRRISGPIWTYATSLSMTGVPDSLVRIGMTRKSSSVFR